MPEITWKEIEWSDAACFEAVVGGFVVLVHRLPYLSGWFLSSNGILTNRALDTDDSEEAKAKALKVVAERLSPAVSALQSAGVWPEGVERG